MAADRQAKEECLNFAFPKFFSWDIWAQGEERRATAVVGLAVWVRELDSEAWVTLIA